MLSEPNACLLLILAGGVGTYCLFVGHLRRRRPPRDFARVLVPLQLVLWPLVFLIAGGSVLISLVVGCSWASFLSLALYGQYDAQLRFGRGGKSPS